ncbi:MAG: hypothetical protein IPM42_16610 [Saprospiraceae bacterium]|nr:hypothetical protein [Saprospiraceae bacterium]
MAHNVISQVTEMGQKLINTPSFIYKNKLWSGFFKDKLVRIVTIVAAVMIPWSLINFISTKFSDVPQSTEDVKLGAAALESQLQFKDLFDGTNKYIVIILIQMLVVFFSNKTIEYLSGVTIHMSVKEMIQSQFRVLVVSVRNWILELILGIGVAIIIGITGPDFLEDWVKYLLGCYFVGFLFIDNYNNSFGMKIKESSQVVRNHAAAAVLVGLVTKILLLIPFAGVLIVSFVCSVATTWYMHTSSDQKDGELAFPE